MQKQSTRQPKPKPPEPPRGSHAEAIANKNAAQLEQLLTELPGCCSDFLNSIADTVTLRTRLAYAYDLRVFFRYLSENIYEFQDQDVRSIMSEQLDKISTRDFERYQQYLTRYKTPAADPTAEPGSLTAYRSYRDNAAPGKMRKMSSLRSFFQYLFTHEYISSNRTSLIQLPKLREKPIVHLEPDEAARLLDLTETGEALTTHQQAYHSALGKRDVAMMTLMLGTGIRVSECVGINMGDVNFEENAFRVTRKGGDQAILYFSDEVADALKAYMMEREQVATLPGHEDALFLSLQRRRITARAVENLVSKYAKTAAPLKRITPHKLRSTYGTTLYKESGDIYLVADVLGHADVNTTRKHYAAMNNERRRKASTLVKLRED
ncbi:MAG: tyrosine-type recombinase/integrase [Oscillospiraceae bacterium]|jgi:site-specific recombinase XerD|nr:tyrosine-type recombinase/integrase [Oscillospiraceae bacterium]